MPLSSRGICHPDALRLFSRTKLSEGGARTSAATAWREWDLKQLQGSRGRRERGARENRANLEGGLIKSGAN